MKLYLRLQGVLHLIYHTDSNPAMELNIANDGVLILAREITNGGVQNLH
jgi:hypothetical protein